MSDTATDFPIACPPGVVPVIQRAHIIQVMALQYIKHMANTAEPLTEAEAFEFAEATWNTDWPGDPQPRSVEAGIEAARADLEYWREE